MKLTNQTQYAVRMLMYCHKKEGLSTTREIAEFYGLPEKFLLKILHLLGKSGFVETVRGRNGGIRLARPAGEIKLGHVIRKVEDNFALAECFENEEVSCPLVSTCGMNEALSRALAAFFGVLNEYSIEDLTREKHNIGVLLQLQEAMKLPYESGQVATIENPAS